jgi:hypothetical protein
VALGVTFSDFVNIAQVIAMVAALAAVWYAEQAVIESRALRREERVARLLELVADFGENGTQFARGRLDGNDLDRERHLLRAALDATGEPLPGCLALLALDWPRYADTDVPEPYRLEAERIAVMGRALDEVAALLVRLRAEGSSTTGSAA